MQTSNHVQKIERKRPPMQFSDVSESRKGNHITRRKQRLTGRSMKRESWES